MEGQPPLFGEKDDMISRSSAAAVFLATTHLAGPIGSAPATAQSETASAPGAPSGAPGSDAPATSSGAVEPSAAAVPNAPSEDPLGEIVVTATKQSESVNRVPLSMTALTQKSLDQLGLRSAQDLARIVPSLTIRRSDNNNLQPSIRGIIASGGAPTTGIYLDDTPLQKRSGIGATVGNGSPFPPIFDLERIEVLRGPQGTLYGGSSEGGTIRFIQPAPGLDKFTAYGRSQLSTTKTGAPSYEAGVAVGGPIVDGVLGFRASLYQQHQGGYLDHYDQYSGRKEINNSNSQNTTSGRLALAWAPSEALRLTAAVYGFRDKLNDATTSWLDEGATTTPARYFTADGRATTAGAANVAFTYPSRTYGPYDFYGANRTGIGYKSPAVSWLLTPTLTADADFDAVQVKSVTSYIRDGQHGLQVLAPANEVPALQAGVPFVQELPDFGAFFNYRNKRTGWTEEFRLSSPTAQRLSWVAGLFYSDLTTKAYNNTVEDLDALTRALRGVPTAVVYGVPLLPGNTAQIRDQRLDELSLAAFGQATFAVTPELKATAGVRVSREKLDYRQAISGPVSGYSVPTVANGGIAEGTVKNTPATPKLGLEYQIGERNLVYVNAAKGFRAGGVNLSLPTTCGPQLAAAGLSTTPQTYAPDTVWAYEGGAKLRLFGNRAQINSSLFWINWKDIQYSVGLPGCVFSYTANAGKAVSRGADVQANISVFEGLSANVSVSYTDAHYQEDIRGPAASGRVGTLLVAKGNELPTPPWSLQVGGQYSRELGNGVSAYLRADYQYSSKYKNGLGPGTNSYAPDTYNSPSTHFVTARAGASISGLEVSVFVNNLFNSQDLISYTGPPAGRYGCSSAACTTSANYSPLFRGVFFRPREVGLTAAYRY
jgi:iron complex outermembrane receptor protein